MPDRTSNLLAAGAERSSSRVSAEPATTAGPGQRGGQTPASDRHDDREHPTGNGREQERLHDHVRAEDRADRGHQLDVAGSGGAEHVPGIISSRPTANPRAEAQSDTPLTPVADSPTPTPASAAVSSFGMRRVSNPRRLRLPSRWRSRRTRD